VQKLIKPQNIHVSVSKYKTTVGKIYIDVTIGPTIDPRVFRSLLLWSFPGKRVPSELKDTKQWDRWSMYTDLKGGVVLNVSPPSGPQGLTSCPSFSVALTVFVTFSDGMNNG